MYTVMKEFWQMMDRNREKWIPEVQDRTKIRCCFMSHNVVTSELGFRKLIFRPLKAEEIIKRRRWFCEYENLATGEIISDKEFEMMSSTKALCEEKMRRMVEIEGVTDKRDIRDVWLSSGETRHLSIVEDCWKEWENCEECKRENEAESKLSPMFSDVGDMNQVCTWSCKGKMNGMCGLPISGMNTLCMIHKARAFRERERGLRWN